MGWDPPPPSLFSMDLPHSVQPLHNQEQTALWDLTLHNYQGLCQSGSPNHTTQLKNLTRFVLTMMITRITMTMVTMMAITISSDCYYPLASTYYQYAPFICTMMIAMMFNLMLIVMVKLVRKRMVMRIPAMKMITMRSDSYHHCPAPGQPHRLIQNIINVFYF